MSLSLKNKISTNQLVKFSESFFEAYPKQQNSYSMVIYFNKGLIIKLLHFGKLETDFYSFYEKDYCDFDNFDRLFDQKFINDYLL